MKYEFKCVEDNVEVVYKFNEVYLPEVLTHVKQFLLASGFIIIGDIEVVREDSDT